VTEFFDLLHPDEQAALEAAGHRRQWKRGAVIFREASRSEAVIILRSGRVKVSSDTASGTEVVLAVRGPGALLGELSAIDGGSLSATVTTLEPVTALSVPSPDFERYLLGHARVSFLMMRELTRRLRDADRKRIEYLAQDTVGRVCSRLVELSDRFGEAEGDGMHIELAITQEDLAGWTGSSREAVIRALRALRELGWIETRRRGVTLLEVEQLRRRAV
jgi:CRP-like cAMP-binding protein